jgi:PKD repeat protein
MKVINMGISRKMPRLTCLIIILTILAFLSNTTPLTKSQETQSPALQITAKTDKNSYLLRQKVTIEGNITKDGTPATDLVVIVQAENPRGTRVACRTLTIGNPTEETWLINITNLFLLDATNNPINTAKIGTQIQAGITIYNWQMTARNVFATVTVFDANMVPLHVGVWSGTLDSQQTLSPRFSVYIETWACTGKILVCGNVYSKEPKAGGMALSQEKTAYFCISKTQQGLIEYPELPPPPPQTTPGVFTTTMRIPPDPLPGQYTLYITGQTGPTETSTTATNFNVETSAGYPPQASFAYWPPEPYENMTVTLDASSSTAEGFNDTIIKYEWDFGDGTPKIIKQGTYTNPPDPTVTHRYVNTGQYITTLNVTDNEGLWSTTSKPITIYPEFGPTANFTYTPTKSVINQTITFDASQSQRGWSKTLGGYSPITNYNWNFSDGTIINTSDPITTHNYTQPENYTVTLKITDSVGRTATVSTLLQVFNVTAKPWDVNQDGIIDIADIYLIALHFGETSSSPNWDPRCDVNNDGIIDIADLYGTALHYGETNP